MIDRDDGHLALSLHPQRSNAEVPDAFDKALDQPKACATMKNLPSTVVASLLALAVTVGVAPVTASSINDAQPQCGDEKKESKGGDKKDDKSSEPKPKPPAQG